MKCLTCVCLRIALLLGLVSLQASAADQGAAAETPQSHLAEVQNTVDEGANVADRNSCIYTPGNPGKQTAKSSDELIKFLYDCRQSAPLGRYSLVVEEIFYAEKRSAPWATAIESRIKKVVSTTQGILNAKVSCRTSICIFHAVFPEHSPGDASPGQFYKAVLRPANGAPIDIGYEGHVTTDHAYTFYFFSLTSPVAYEEPMRRMLGR